MKPYLIIGAIAVMGISCSHEEQDRVIANGLHELRHLSVNIRTLPFDGESSCTKSAFDQYQDKISGINALVFRADGDKKLLKDCSGYFSLDELREMTLPSSGVFKLYFFANVPDLTASFPADENGLENFGYCMGSYDEFARRGFPMAYSQVIDTGADESINIWFKRLVTRLELSFDKSALSASHREGTFIKSLRLCNAALDIYPFAKNGSQATRTTGEQALSDAALEADVDRLNAGEAIFLYTLANMQGILLPQDTPQSGKTPQNLSKSVSADKLKLLTYIEARCELDGDDWKSEDVTLRHYLGGDCPEDYNCSFNVYPGKTRIMRLVLSDDDPLLQAWRFEAEDIDYKRFEIDAEEVHVMKGFPAELTVSAPFDFEISSCGEHFSAEIIDQKYDGSKEKWKKLIRIQTTKALSGLLAPGQAASCLSENLVLKSLTRSMREACVSVKIYHQVFPLSFGIDGAGMLSVHGDNPLGLGLRYDCTVMDSNGNPLQNISGTNPDIGKLHLPDDQNIILSLSISPLWKNNNGFFMGSGNAAFFGPGVFYSPANLDATKIIMYKKPSAFVPDVIDFYSNTEYHTDMTYTCRGSDKEPQVAFLPSDNEGDPALKTTCGFVWGKLDYRFKIGDFKPAGSTGHNNCDNYTLTDFEQCPFYITNGCMQGIHLDLYTHSWNATNKLEEVKVRFYSPGRDLLENKDQSAFESALCFRINGKWHSWGIETWIEEASYTFSGIHLVINGCTCWPGGSASKYGILE